MIIIYLSFYLHLSNFILLQEMYIAADHVAELSRSIANNIHPFQLKQPRSRVLSLTRRKTLVGFGHVFPRI